jgi:hypothetical protein
MPDIPEEAGKLLIRDMRELLSPDKPATEDMRKAALRRVLLFEAMYVDGKAKGSDSHT